MTRGAFRQADMERIFRAAKASGSIVKIDLRTLVVTIHPINPKDMDPLTGLAPDGPENWGEHGRKPPRYGSENWEDG